MYSIVRNKKGGGGGSAALFLYYPKEGFINMKRYFFVVLFFLAGCLDSTDFMKAKFVKPEEVRRYKPKGAYVFATIDIENSQFISAIFFMFGKAEDATFIPSGNFGVFLFDISEKTTGLERIGFRYFAFGTDFWMNKPLYFTIQKGKVNYLGRFIFYEKTMLKPHRALVTNLLDEDLKVLGDYYPELTNMQVEFTGIPEGWYNFY